MTDVGSDYLARSSEEWKSLRRSTARNVWFFEGVVGLGIVVSFAAVALQKNWIELLGLGIVCIGTLCVLWAMIRESYKVARFRRNNFWAPIAVKELQKQGQRIKECYEETSDLSTRVWRYVFLIIALMGTLACAGFLAATFAGAVPFTFVVIGFLMGIPAVVCWRFSERLLNCWRDAVMGGQEGVLRNIDYVKGTSTAREIAGYWIAFVIIIVAGLVPFGDDSVVTIYGPTILSLLTVVSFGRVLNGGYKEFKESLVMSVNESGKGS